MDLKKELSEIDSSKQEPVWFKKIHTGSFLCLERWKVPAEIICSEQRKQIYDFIHDIVLEHDIEIQDELMPEDPEISYMFYKTGACAVVAGRGARKYVITCRRTKNPAVIMPEMEEILYGL